MPRIICVCAGSDSSQFILSLEDLLDSWITFYQSLMPYRSEVVIASFPEVIRDFGAIIERVNDRFGTQFERFVHTEEQVQAVNQKQGYHAGPSDQRDRLKKRARSRLAAEQQRSSFRARREEAEHCYDAFVAKDH